MTLFHALTDRQAALLSGGGGEPLPNPSEVYCGTNYGQAKKEDPCLPNPSEVYCGTNYGQYKKDL